MIGSVDEAVFIVFLFDWFPGGDLGSKFFIVLGWGFFPGLDLVAELVDEVVLVWNDIKIKIDIELVIVFILEQVPIVNFVIDLALFL